MSPPTSARSVLQSAEAVVLRAAAAIRAVAGGGATIWDKAAGGSRSDGSARDPVTEADLGAHAVLDEGLRTVVDVPVWSEEGARPDQNSSRYWLVDPLDGTREFVEGTPEYAVSVALVEGGTVRLAVVCNPATGRMVSWSDSGAAQSEGVARHPGTATGGPPVALVSRQEWRRGECAFLGAAVELAVVGSTAWKLALLSQGEGDLYLTPAPRHPWDVAAGIGLVEAAGFRITDAFDRAIDLRPGAALPRGVLCAKPDLHRRIRPLLQSEVERRRG